ncbi:TatD family hydrolase [Peribacillus glennii]|uniref:TatD family deoxyribonuclease n=1 Tax=Peribacillus glennii TaxID=2303991 RepID=A0A372LG52_9BACI|nr:TatD family hydrolase [Peribacillus glennii]RFU65285.1 TatD family deoxyribonuclease [Peribacillus glennii]
MKKIIDAHIHLDRYGLESVNEYFSADDTLQLVITVSKDFNSCMNNLRLCLNDRRVQPAFGFHPEQDLPSDRELEDLFNWMAAHQDSMVAVGEVGLPYYKKKDSGGSPLNNEKYIDMLEMFILHAKQWNKPIVLHAIYEDAPIACSLLEKHSISDAQFHWFKGDTKTIERIASNGHYISVTPDVVYKQKTRDLVSAFPIGQIMVETDGPWPFEGPFQYKKTHSSMIHKSIKTIASIKKLAINETYQLLYQNTFAFFSLN